MKTMLVALMVLVAFTGCSTFTPPAGTPSDPLSQLVAFKVADLTAALNDATAHNDQAGVMCWGGLLKIIPSVLPGQAPQIVGAATAIQLKRDLLSQSGGASAIMSQINLACAALANDEVATFGRLAGAAALAAPKIP